MLQEGDGIHDTVLSPVKCCLWPGHVKECSLPVKVICRCLLNPSPLYGSSWAFVCSPAVTCVWDAAVARSVLLLYHPSLSKMVYYDHAVVFETFRSVKSRDLHRRDWDCELVDLISVYHSDRQGPVHPSLHSSLLHPYSDLCSTSPIRSYHAIRSIIIP
jgi:hypothetical protein